MSQFFLKFSGTFLKTTIFSVVSEKTDDVITYSKSRSDFFDPRLQHYHTANINISDQYFER